MRNGIEWNHEGFEDILCCEGSSAVCEQEARRIMASAASAGGEYSLHSEIVTMFGSKRVEWFVKAEDREANRQCSENKVLERAI